MSVLPHSCTKKRSVFRNFLGCQNVLTVTSAFAVKFVVKGKAAKLVKLGNEKAVTIVGALVLDFRESAQATRL